MNKKDISNKTKAKSTVDISKARWICLLITGNIQPIVDRLNSLPFIHDFKQEMMRGKNEMTISHKEQGFNYLFVLIRPTPSNINYLREMHGVFRMSGKSKEGIFTPIFYNMDNLNDVLEVQNKQRAKRKKIEIGDRVEVVSGLFRDHTGTVQDIQEGNITLEMYMADIPLTVVVASDSVVPL